MSAEAAPDGRAGGAPGARPGGWPAAGPAPLAGPGATVVVTGGTGGIGLATATGLAATGARLVVLGRDPGRGAQAAGSLREAGAADALFVAADLSSLASVAGAVEQVRRSVGRPDVVVANAGGLYTDRWLTADGIEASLAMNLVGPVALLEALTAGPGRTRVVGVSTGAVRLARPATEDPQRTASYPPMDVYGSTKLYGAAALLALGRERDDLDVVVVDPGGAATDMTAGMSARTLPWAMRPGLPLMRLAQRWMTPEKASRSSVAAATDPAVPPGAWLDPRGRVRPLPRRLRDAGLGTWALELARTLASERRTPPAAA